jgi:hypothetical protein
MTQPHVLLLLLLSLLLLLLHSLLLLQLNSLLSLLLLSWPKTAAGPGQMPDPYFESNSYTNEQLLPWGSLLA